MRFIGRIICFLFLQAFAGALYAADPPQEQVKTPAQIGRFSAQELEAIRYWGVQAKFMTLIENPATLSPELLNDIDFSVRSIAFYRTSDRQNKRFPRTFYESLEQKMIDRFLAVKRFSVHECFECKTTRVLLKKSSFKVLRQMDSNESLKKVGKEIGVDAFLLWDAFLYKNEPVLNLRIVSSENGQVRWSKQYKRQAAFEYKWEFYTSYWNLSATRASTGSAADIAVSPLLAVGTRSVTNSTISRFMHYGIGSELFFNTTDRDQINVWGFNINGRIALEIDTLFGSRRKNYGNWLIYTSIAQAFLKSSPTLQAGSGLEIRLNKNSYIGIGMMWFRPQSFKVTANSNYDPTATLSGLGYDFTLGMRF